MPAPPPRARRKVVVLGGGMAGLTAAWALSGPDERAELDVCVVEPAPHLGGKGASTRGVHGRIEEHGLHVWLGYYDNAFALMRAVYDELDRPARDPGCPIAGWRDAFAPADLVGVLDHHDGEWAPWVASFGRNDAEPGAAGAGGDADAGGALTVAAFVRRGLGLLLDVAGSLRPAPARAPAVVLSGSPATPPVARGADGLDDFAELLRRAEIGALVAGVESLRVLRAGLPAGGPLASIVLESLDRLRGDVLDRLRRRDDGRRAAQLADLVVTAVQGAVRDGLLTAERGFAVADDEDFRAWLARHGARDDTLRSPLIRGMYDLVFAYEDGDPGRPRFPAGLGLFLAGKLFFGYRGAIFWRLQAGMGDVVFVPLLQALRRRGVRFRFGHRAERLVLSRDRTHVASVVLSRAAGATGAGDAPVRVRGLPCFPSPGTPPGGARERVVLTAGAGFDELVLAAPLGVVPAVCRELLDDAPRWRAMAEAVTTVPTQALQVWLGEGERALGWPYPGATVSGYVTPFDTYASMSHLLEREDWPGAARPAALAYFCSVLPPAAAAGGPGPVHAFVRANAEAFLRRDAGRVWPGALDADGDFRWDLLCGAGGAVRGRARLDAQHWRANVAPSERYVQSPPGSVSRRLRADRSGYANLTLAGDWTDSGLPAGCIEAAVLSGLRAANAVCGRPPGHGVAGAWLPLGAA